MSFLLLALVLCDWSQAAQCEQRDSMCGNCTAAAGCVFCRSTPLDWDVGVCVDAANSTSCQVSDATLRASFVIFVTDDARAIEVGSLAPTVFTDCKDVPKAPTSFQKRDLCAVVNNEISYDLLRTKPGDIKQVAI